MAVKTVDDLLDDSQRADLQEKLDVKRRQLDQVFSPLHLFFFPMIPSRFYIKSFLFHIHGAFQQPGSQAKLGLVSRELDQVSVCCDSFRTLCRKKIF
jgi:hypothetical protein